MPSASYRRHCRKLLGVSQNSTKDELKAAYKELALKWHPDRHRDAIKKELAQQTFIEINQAYRYLVHKIERRERRSVGANESGRIKSRKGLLEQHANTPPLLSAPATPPPPPPPLLPAAAAPPAPPTSSRSPSPVRSASSSMSGRRNTSGKHPFGSETQTTPPSSPKGHQARPDPEVKLPVKQFSTKPKHWATQLYRFGNALGFPKGGSTGLTQPKRPPSRWYRKRADAQTTTNIYTRPHSPYRADLRADGPDVKSSPKIDGLRSGHYFEPTARSKPHKRGAERQSETRPAREAVHKQKKQAPPSTTWTSQAQAAPPSGTRLPHKHSTYAREWEYPLKLTLEEIFYGSALKFRITRHLKSQQKSQVEIKVTIPRGCRAGTRILCAGAGNERSNGTFQDIVFLVEELPHPRFQRVRDDLYLDMRIPWSKSMSPNSGVLFLGMDGEEHRVSIPRAAPHLETLISGAGMPIRQGNKVVGRGDLIIRWEFIVTGSPLRWNMEFVKNMLQFNRR